MGHSGCWGIVSTWQTCPEGLCVCWEFGFQLGSGLIFTDGRIESDLSARSSCQSDPSESPRMAVLLPVLNSPLCFRGNSIKSCHFRLSRPFSQPAIQGTGHNKGSSFLFAKVIHASPCKLDFSFCKIGYQSAQTGLCNSNKQVQKSQWHGTIKMYFLLMLHVHHRLVGISAYSTHLAKSRLMQPLLQTLLACHYSGRNMKCYPIWSNVLLHFTRHWPELFTWLHLTNHKGVRK